MTIEELIRELQKYPEKTEIWISTNEDPNEIKDIKLITNEEEELYSKHETPSRYNQKFPYIMISDGN